MSGRITAATGTMQSENRSGMMLLSCGVTKISKPCAARWSLIIWLNFAAPLFSQPSDIRFEHISVEQGLSNFALTKIVQDQQGFLWFGTEDGLNKYDGYEFTVYKPDPADAHSLPGRFIQTLHVDRQGQLWIGVGIEGLCRYNANTDKFERFKDDPLDPESLAGKLVCAILEDGNGELWIGTSDGLYRYNRARDDFVIYRHDPHDTSSISRDFVTAICEDRKGNLWIGTSEGGLNRFDRGKNAFLRYGDSQSPSGVGRATIICLQEDPASPGSIWMGTHSGLYRYDVQINTIVRYALTPDTIFDLYVDSRGTLWVATFHIGLWRYDAATNHFFQYRHDPENPHSLSEDRISCIYEDRSGVMWMGTYRSGLNRYDRRQDAFTRYATESEVYAVTQDRGGELWIGTASAGLLRYDQGGKRVAQYRHDPNNSMSLSSDVILSLHEDSRGELWIGTGWGLCRYEAKRNRFVRYLHEPIIVPGPGEYFEVKAIYEDREGEIWIGTKGSGLCRLDREKKTFSYYRHDPKNPQSISGNSIWAIQPDQNGDLWVGTFGNGVNHFARKTQSFSRYLSDSKNPHSLNNGAIYSLCLDPNGYIWIGTYGSGLNGFDPGTGRFVHYTEREGLPDNFVKSVQRDQHDNLWLSTDKGLCKFNPKKKAIKNFIVKDGLISNQFLSGASYQSRDGRLFFGGEGGVIAFYPDSLKDNPYIPPVVITRFNVFDKPLPLPRSHSTSEKIKLSYRQNFFSFDFVTLDYTVPLKIQYAYKLEGFDADWVYCGVRRYASYTNVDPGEYVFRVKGTNSDGVWNEQGAAVNIMITPPFWKTWWFRALAIFSVLISAFTWHQRRMRREEAKRKALELQVQEKSEAAQTLQKALAEVERLKNRLHAENVYLQDEIKLEHNFADFISRSQALKKILSKVEQVAATDATVMILGESGTGKELLARAVHNLSIRRDRPMVKVNCAVLPANLIESELFGHEKGAFTGAISRKIGRFELADGGTIFLDEIGELPLELQAKLLRVLQEGEFERVGGQQTMKVDTRVIAATNRELQEEIAHGRFREDLYYRLQVFPITIPPLRERREDIPLLIHHFVKKCSAKAGKKIETVSQHVIETLQAYDWPGNVRELENVIERAVIVSQGKQLKLDDWLPHHGIAADEPSVVTLDDVERSHIIKTLKITQWRISGERGAAKILNIKPTTLRSRMEKLGIRR